MSEAVDADAGTAACTASEACKAPQPLSWYWTVKLLDVMVAVEGEIVALPEVTQALVSVTLTGDPTEAPVAFRTRVVCP